MSCLALKYRGFKVEYLALHVGNCALGVEHARADNKALARQGTDALEFLLRQFDLTLLGSALLLERIDFALQQILQVPPAPPGAG